MLTVHSDHKRGVFALYELLFTKNEGHKGPSQQTFVMYSKHKQMKTISIIIVALGALCVFYQQYLETKAKKTDH